MAAKKLIILSITIILILNSIALLFFYNEESEIKEKIKDFIGMDVGDEVSNQELDIINEEEEETEEIGVEGGNGNSNPGSTPSGEEPCSMDQISYSLKNFNESFECLNHNSNSECIDLIAECSVEIHNLDSENSTGVFKISYSIISEGEILGIDYFEETIPLGEFRIFNPKFTFGNSEGLSESLDCKIMIEDIPKKGTC
jgi:hypothetical protein